MTNYINNETKHRIFVIGDGWDLPRQPSSNKQQGVKFNDMKWPKKNFINDPDSLYNSWADMVANKLDANIYYIQDHDLSFGGAIKETIRLIEEYSDEEDVINYYFLNVPLYKGKLGLLSTSPEENARLEKLQKVIFKGHPTEVAGALQELNDHTLNDHKMLKELRTEFCEIVNEVSDYYNRFLIHSTQYHNLEDWYIQQVFNDIRKHGEESVYYDQVTNKKQLDLEIMRHRKLNEERDNNTNAVTKQKIKQKRRLIDQPHINIKWTDPKWSQKLFSDVLFENLDKDLDFVHIINHTIAQKITHLHKVRAKADPKESDIIRDIRTGSQYNSSFKTRTIDKREHERIGEKIYKDLTEETKLFTIQYD